ncbi:MAG TPA: low specificity L-threonine aldolase [Acidimicrobiales bacterium]|nr:low specificity L-threonine aldolase [Acidimicrobiales bacterium]
MAGNEAVPVVRHDASRRMFASDNYAGAHPGVLAAMAAANGGHQVSYGADEYSSSLAGVMKQRFGDRCETFCVLNGTGANVVALQSMTKRWSAVICSESAHINVDECAAPERVGGLKLLSVPSQDGKLTVEAMRARLSGLGDEHRAQPDVVSISQATEYGTCYSVDEVTEVCRWSHEAGLAVHMDGARLCNAAAYLEVSLRALTTDAGVDVVSFGGTKNGAMLADAVLVLNPDAVDGLKYLRKTSMQLASKMRFIAVQLEALLEGELWLENASHANAMAHRLAERLAGVAGVRVSQEVQANAVFAVLSPAVADRLREHYAFYTWDEATGEVRWMTSFDTTVEDVDAFAGLIRAELGEQP